jgi:hypothetical protein
MFKVVFWVILPCKIRRQYTPLKCRSTIILHGSIYQKTTLNINVIALITYRYSETVRKECSVNKSRALTAEQRSLRNEYFGSLCSLLIG